MPAKKQETVPQIAFESKVTPGPRKIEPEPPRHEHSFYLSGQGQGVQYWKCSGCPYVEERPYVAPAAQPQPKGFLGRLPSGVKESQYKVRYLCKNCAFKFKAKFIHGNPADKSMLCPNCGVSDSKKR